MEKESTANGIEITDTVRFFYGDGPAAHSKLVTNRVVHTALLVVGLTVDNSVI